MTDFRLPDMNCGHCVATVSQALKAADPACEVRIDLPSKTVEVHSAKPREALAAVLAEAGYPPA